MLSATGVAVQNNVTSSLLNSVHCRLPCVFVELLMWMDGLIQLAVRKETYLLSYNANSSDNSGVFRFYTIASADYNKSAIECCRCFNQIL